MHWKRTLRHTAMMAMAVVAVTACSMNLAPLKRELPKFIAPCQQAFRTPIDELSAPEAPIGPVAVVWFNNIYLPDEAIIPTWNVSTRDPEAVSCLACLRMHYVNAGRYSDGTVATRHDVDVWIISWPDGEVLGGRTIQGTPPKSRKQSGSADGSYADEDAIEAWLVSLREGG